MCNFTGNNLGYFYKEENAAIAAKLKVAFAEWIDNGHNNFEDENTCILCIRLTDGILYSHDTRYNIDFTLHHPSSNDNTGGGSGQCGKQGSL